MDKLNQSKDGKTLYVSIFWADDDKVRSLNQNRIYWQYLTNISQHTGTSKDTLHTDFKRQFLVVVCLGKVAKLVNERGLGRVQ